MCRRRDRDDRRLPRHRSAEAADILVSEEAATYRPEMQ